jgi:hypothetical protein
VSKKAKKRLEASRRNATLKSEILLTKNQLELTQDKLQYHARAYLNALLDLYSTATEPQRRKLEEEYAKHAKTPLHAEYEARIMAALSIDSGAASKI